MTAVSPTPTQVVPRAETSTSAQILRASALIGGATALNVLIGLVKTKALAILLGPAGVGLLGILASVSDLARSIAQLGIHGSGVRQIAEAVGTQDSNRIARTIIVLRRTALVLGLVGMLTLVAMAKAASMWAFGDAAHATSIAWVSIAVFFRLVADGQAALLQGMRRVGDLARVGVVGALAGAVASVVLAAWLGEAGIVPGVVASAALAALVSWRVARRVRVEPVHLSVSQVCEEAGTLLKLGLAFLASAAMMAGAAFAVRAMVLRQGGMEEAGLYQAAWTLGGMYVGFVLQAMGTDFYPRLVGVSGNPSASNRMVNEQAQISLLLAGPGVIGTMVLAQQVVTIFYSAAFAEAGPVLRWICLGMALRVISWPLGYIVLALNRRMIFFGAELAWTVVNVLLSWLCVHKFGLAGAGFAFFASYVFHCLLVYAIAKRLQDFSWDAATRNQIVWFVASTAIAFLAFLTLGNSWATTAIGAVVLCISTAHSLNALARLAPDMVPARLGRVVELARRTRERLP